jgi:diguanylate cyclase (GGDEF)-like protein
VSADPPPSPASAVRPGAFANWKLRTVPIAAKVFLLLVEASAVAVTAWLLLTQPVDTAEWVRLGVLTALAVGYAEAGARIERLKRYLSPGGDKVAANQVSVWAFAAVLTVPAGWAGVLIALLYTQSLIRRGRDRTGVPYRVVFGAATVVLSAEAASALVAWVGGGDVLRGGLRAPVAIVGAVLVFTLINFGVLLTGMCLVRRPPTLRVMLPDSESLGYEIATLALGIVTAEFLVHSLALTPVALILAAYLHRSSLVNSLHRASRTDTKTGLPNLTAWTEHAQAVLAHSHRRGEAVTVLFCDLDHFKVVNDVYGHLVGDHVLTSVAQCLRRELRGHDGIGRFGGEEFVVVLDSISPAEADLVAGRLRTAVSALRFADGPSITVSVGMASHQPGPVAPDLQHLIGRADTALRVAKAEGRNQVRAA